MSFTFNKKYDDHDQVAEFFPAYMAVYEEITGAGRYPYNDSFKGRIPGIEGPNEDTAIYLLQGTRYLQELQVQIDAALADGCEPLDSLDIETKFSRVIHYGFYMGGTGWQEWNDARLIPQDRPKQAAITGGIKAVLPKGKRTHGHFISGGKILVKR